MKRPGFCRFHVERGDKLSITDFHTASLDNKKNVKPHGQLMDEIGKIFVNFIPETEEQIYFVREKAFNARAAQSEIGIYKVIGVMDWMLYRMKQEWYEIYPVSVKKLVTGSGKADKIAVADALPLYLGQHEYQNDDESDAAAVAVAFLVDNNLLKTIIVEQEGGDNDVSNTPEVHQSV